MKIRRAAIKGISTHLPSSVLTNEQLANDFKDWDVDKIFNKTGIAKRHIADTEECASDLGVAAAEKLFASGSCKPNSVDFLLFCTETPDYFLPASACIMHDRLGLRTDCGALDFNLGCSGFVYGLALAKGLIENGLADQVLLLTADTYSKLINPMDRSVRTLFGDGAAATLISDIMSEEELIGPFVFGTDGRGADRLIVPAGGFRLKPSQATAITRDDGTGNVRSLENLYMDGPEIFNFSLREVPKTIGELLQKANMIKDDVDFFIFHQANKFMLEQLRRKLKIPEEKFCINMESYGNTVAATIPMALEIAIHKGQIKYGDKIMLVGFGVGYSWGGTLIKY